VQVTAGLKIVAPAEPGLAPPVTIKLFSTPEVPTCFHDTPAQLMKLQHHYHFIFSPSAGLLKTM
jgi:hypothetical protein